MIAAISEIVTQRWSHLRETSFLTSCFFLSVSLCEDVSVFIHSDPVNGAKMCRGHLAQSPIMKKSSFSVGVNQSIVFSHSNICKFW